MSKEYITKHFDDIKKYGNIIEHRLFDDDLTIEQLIEDNKKMLEQAKKYNLNYILIDSVYKIRI